MSKEAQVKKQKAYQKYLDKLSKMTKEELEKEEQKLIKSADKLNEDVVKKSFELKYEGYLDAAKAVQYFLNKQEIDQNYLTGLITMYEFWNPDFKKDKIDFPTLDSTLRLIGGMKFKGYDEWTKAMKIIDYFKYLYEDYSSVTEEIYDTAERHNAVIEKLKLFNPVPINESKQLN